MQNLMEISFDYYKVFYEVARSHSITLAASHLCLTQPTVTKYIKNLEAVLNCQLFLRSQKGVSLTSEGQRLYRQISHPCQQMGQAQEVIREYVTNQDGRITISATELTMRYFLLPFMERFQHCFPNVKLQIHAHSFPTAITSLREETSDFALSITPLDNCYDFEVTQVSDFQDILIAGSRYSYLENRILSMEEILTYPIISMETGFLNYYLPTTLKLLENYASFEEAGVSGENLSQAKAKIEKTMDSIVAGFEHQLDELYRTDAMDIDSDIRVMETMLRRDTASVADDFGLNGSSAVQQRDE